MRRNYLTCNSLDIVGKVHTAKIELPYQTDCFFTSCDMVMLIFQSENTSISFVLSHKTFGKWETLQIVMRGGEGDVDVLRCDDVMLCDGGRYSRDMTEGVS